MNAEQQNISAVSARQKRQRRYKAAAQNRMVVAAYRQRQLDMPDDVREWLGKVGENDVFGIFDELHERPKWYMRDQEKPATIAGMTMKNADGYCYLDSPTTWNEVDIWMQHLYSDGTPLTKEVLLQKGVDGVNYLEQAARSGAFASLVRVLALQGEYLAAEDLLQPDGKPNGVLKAAVAWGQHGALFTLTQGKQHEAGHMQRLYRLLPPSARKEVAGFHALTQRLQEHFADKSEQQSR